MKTRQIHSLASSREPITRRVYHENPNCPIAQAIPLHERGKGTGGYNPCPVCAEISRRPSQRDA